MSSRHLHLDNCTPAQAQPWLNWTPLHQGKTALHGPVSHCRGHHSIAFMRFKTMVLSCKAVNETTPIYPQTLVRTHAAVRALRTAPSAGWLMPPSLRANKGFSAKSQLFVSFCSSASVMEWTPDYFQDSRVTRHLMQKTHDSLIQTPPWPCIALCILKCTYHNWLWTEGSVKYSKGKCLVDTSTGGNVPTSVVSHKQMFENHFEQWSVWSHRAVRLPPSYPSHDMKVSSVTWKVNM